MTYVRPFVVSLLSASVVSYPITASTQSPATGSATVTVKGFGAKCDGAADDAPAFRTALASGTAIRADGVCRFGSPVTIPANKRLYGPATIMPVAGYADPFLLLMSAGSTLEVDTIDGDNKMPLPTATWFGAGSGIARAPVGIAVFINGDTKSPVPNVRIKVRTFQNFPSGPIAAFYADGLVVENGRFVNTQTYTRNETNGVVHSHGGNNVKYIGGHIEKFNWKGWYIANANGAQMDKVTTAGGVAGHASHYFSGCHNCSITGGSQTGGFGIKAFKSSDISVNNFQSSESAGAGIYMQAVKGFVIEGNMIRQPRTYGILLEALDGPGGVTGGVVKANNIAYTPAGVAGQVAIRIAGSSSGIADDIAVDGNEIRAPFWGIHIPKGPGWTHSRIRVTNNILRSSTQYGIVAFIKSIEIASNDIEMSTDFPCVYLAAQISVPGDTIRVVRNRTRNTSRKGVHYQIGTSRDSVKFEKIEFDDNQGSGGEVFAAFAFNNDPSDYVSALIFEGNTAADVASTNAVDIVFNAKTKVREVQIKNNSLMDSNKSKKNIALANMENIERAVLEGNEVSEITNRPRNTSSISP